MVCPVFYAAGTTGQKHSPTGSHGKSFHCVNYSKTMGESQRAVARGTDERIFAKKLFEILVLCYDIFRTTNRECKKKDVFG